LVVLHGGSGSAEEKNVNCRSLKDERGSHIKGLGFTGGRGPVQN